MTELTLSAYMTQESTKAEQARRVFCRLAESCIPGSLYSRKQHSGESGGLE